ncbi:MAG: hypothetical protein EBQ56_00935 [Proteobacteria bacterium]|jgi:hypothetical protein|nr:hypothetical protein [Actinomycetota bacterium]NBY46344.1 hypothetical protein [Pseudomonadota bacterium]
MPSYTGATTLINGPFGSPVPVYANDLSSQFDGAVAAFTLSLDQGLLSVTTGAVVASTQCTVTLNGQALPPYLPETTYPWIRDFDALGGFRASGSVIAFTAAPQPGDIATVAVTSGATASQVRRYPFSAATIGIGD